MAGVDGAIPGARSPGTRASGTGPGDAQVLQFSTDAFPEHQRIEAWREVFGRTLLSIEITPSAKDGFHASATTFRSPALGLLRGSTSPARQGNRRSLIRGDDVTFSWVLASRLIASKLGRNAELGPGDGVLMTNEDVGEMSFPEPCAYMSFRIPRSILASLVPDIGTLVARRVPASNPALRMLSRYVDLEHTDLIATEPALQAAFTNHACDLLALALGATRDAAEVARARGLPAARLRAMQDDIRRGYHRADLSVHAVAAQHAVSIRYVQRIFEESGTTFTQYLAEQRLAAAYDALRRPSAAALPVSTIAYDCGFSDISHFNRLFRRRFGASPMEVRKAVRSGEE
jgi:AraC-like DNA-binding protein